MNDNNNESPSWLEVKIHAAFVAVVIIIATIIIVLS